VAAEDTRQTIKLLNHFGIKKPLVSYYEHNRVGKGCYLVERLLEGKNVALVSDAGSPGISDPGEELVGLAVKNSIPVTMAPGPAALITGLVLSGLPAGKFAFEGFLTTNKRLRLERLHSLTEEQRTLVFYEAPHKLVRTLKDFLGTFGNRRIVLARELTKKFEEITRCTVEEALKIYENKLPKGEFVLVLEGADRKQTGENSRKRWADLCMEEHLELYLKQGLKKMDAIKKVAEERGLSKREVYALLVKDK